MKEVKAFAFLTKLEAEKLPIIQSLSIEIFKGKDYLNISSEDYQRLSFYLYWLLRYHFRHVSNTKTGSNFWLCYEYEKPFLWSIVEDSFIKDLLSLILLPIKLENINDFLLILYTDLGQRLKLNLGFEKISLNWVLNNNIYTDLNTGNGYLCDDMHCIYEIIKGKSYYSYVILDQNHLSLSINEQISFILNKLRNLS